MNYKQLEQLNKQYDKGLEFRKNADNTVLWACRAIVVFCISYILFHSTLNISIFNNFCNHFAIFLLLFPAEITLILDYISTRIYSNKLENLSNGDEIISVKILNKIGNICFYITIIILNLLLILFEFYEKQ